MTAIKTAGQRSEPAPAEQALLDSQEWYRLVMRATSDVLWDWHLTSEMTLSGESFGTLLGYPAFAHADMLCRLPVTAWHDLVHPDDRADLVKRVAKIRGGTLDHWSAEYRLRRADGSYVTVVDRASVVRNADGAVVRAVGALTDITERKRVEELQREAREAAEAANRAKSDFLANMSHEIRTPMNGVMGMLELVLDTPLTDEQRECIGIARASADSLLAVINDILDFSKIEAGTLDLEPVAFSPRDAIADTVGPLALRAREKHLDVGVQIGDDVPAALIGDRGRLRQILVNLVGNAIKFTERGEVSVRVGAESPAGDDVTLHFSVRDTGEGIPQEKQALIFDAFAQADASVTRQFGGTGLGLAISTRLVAMMGGRLWVESAVNEGSTFHFTAVFRRDTSSAHARPGSSGASAAPAALMPRIAPSQRSLRILLAEDNPVNRQLAIALLRKRGHTVRAASNGAEAVAAWKQESFDVILMDVQMPELDGLAATAIIREEEAGGRHIPIVAITACAMTGDRERFLAAGMDAYLPKPITSAALFATIETLCPDTAAVDPASIDTVALMRMVDNDHDLLATLFALFLSDAPMQIEQMRAALATSDATTLRGAAHSLKGSAANLRITRIAETAARIESAARRNDFVAAGPAVADLERAFATVAPAFDAILRKAA